MIYVLVRHRVRDFAAWKAVFDAHGATRQAAGSKGAHLFRSLDDPNDLLITLQWEDAEQARRFVASADLREVMERAGVIGAPDVQFLESVERAPA